MITTSLIIIHHHTVDLLLFHSPLQAPSPLRLDRFPLISSMNFCFILFVHLCPFFRLQYEGNHTVFVFLHLTYFISKHKIFKIHPRCHKWQDVLFCSWLIFHSVCILHLP